MAGLTAAQRTSARRAETLAVPIPEGVGMTPGQTPPPVPEPATAYAFTSTPLISRLRGAVATRRTGAAVTSRVPFRSDVDSYSHTAKPAEQPQTPQPVRSSLFQTVLVGPIVNVSTNLGLYRAGFPISGALLRPNPGWTFQAPKATTAQRAKTSMTPRPAYGRVQNVPKYRTRPGVYPTKSAGV